MCSQLRQSRDARRHFALKIASEVLGSGMVGSTGDRGAERWRCVPDLNTYHSPPVHWETPIRLHDNGAEFHVLRVGTVALWSEPAHGSHKTVESRGVRE